MQPCANQVGRDLPVDIWLKLFAKRVQDGFFVEAPQQRDLSDAQGLFVVELPTGEAGCVNAA